jgi:hypothetical protein
MRAGNATEAAAWLRRLYALDAALREAERPPGQTNRKLTYVGHALAVGLWKTHLLRHHQCRARPLRRRL